MLDLLIFVSVTCLSLLIVAVTLIVIAAAYLAIKKEIKK